LNLESGKKKRVVGKPKQALFDNLRELYHKVPQEGRKESYFPVTIPVNKRRVSL